MWTAVAWIEFGLSGLPPATHITRCSAPVAAKHAVLEIMSPNSGDLSLQLEHHWGSISDSHVFFNNHEDPFEAVVEPSADGVQVTFTGWEEHPFVATAARIRMVYHRPGAGLVDFVAEAMPDGEVRIRPAGRTLIHGRKVAVRLGCSDVRYVQNDCN
jgi:hypothetical protein